MILPLNEQASVSFEFFPPKTAEAGVLLRNTLQTLGALGPQFVSITYGAGGSTQSETLSLVKTLAPVLTTAGHLTCVGRSAGEVMAVAELYYQAGVRHIIALRGDMPAGQPFEAHPQGFADAAALTAALRKQFPDITISVAAYPEKHPSSPTPAADLENLKRKLDAGADQAITQFFFDNEAFRRFYDSARGIGISAPIIPGILPIMNYKSTAAFAAKCGARIPGHLATLFDTPDDNAQTRLIIAAVAAASQCNALRTLGITHFHFYTLNRHELTLVLARILGMRADGDRFERIKAACDAYF
jgi:methylenetetrahydrofolate reductase (NADPH)